jgi:anaerobic magnesium-protoporphyrin IX monomethyl ester cyclase
MPPRKRVVLVHPHGHNWYAGAKDVVRIANVMPPHGLMLLAAVLKRAGVLASIVDLFAHPAFAEDAVGEILAREPDCVGFTATTAGFLPGYRLAERLKAARPALPVLFGGAHPTALWRELLVRYPALDMIVVGEGEATMVELAAADFRPSRDIAGLAFRDASGEPVFPGPRPLLRDLDSLPRPAYEELSGFPKSYPMPIFNYPRSPATTMISSRGCPYACSYCDRSVFGSTFRYHSAPYLVDHLTFLKQRYGIRHVGFYDDNFMLRRSHVTEFAELLLKRRLGITFNCIGRSDHLDRELLRLMRRAGCWMINIGIESGDEALIQQHRRNAEQERVVEAMGMIRASGIRVKGLFMMGIPGESEESIQRTIDFVARHPLDDANLTKFTPFPGSPLYASVREHGRFDEDWDRMNCTNFVFIPKGLSLEQLERHYLRFYRSFWGGPSGLWRLLSMAWKSPDSLLRFVTQFRHFLEAERSMRPKPASKGAPAEAH